jgi:hypothetical protein
MLALMLYSCRFSSPMRWQQQRTIQWQQARISVRQYIRTIASNINGGDG